jgi:hypothetical protein
LKGKYFGKIVEVLIGANNFVSARNMMEHLAKKSGFLFRLARQPDDASTSKPHRRAMARRRLRRSGKWRYHPRSGADPRILSSSLL